MLPTRKITAAISGGLGDTIYALPAMHLLGVTRLYVKKRAMEDGSNTYDALRDLIELQEIECLPTDGNYDFMKYEPGLKYDYDLDESRLQKWRGSTHLIVSFMNRFNCFQTGWRRPWLRGIEELSFRPDYNLLMVTPRWREQSHINWTNVLGSVIEPICFAGFKKDHKDFMERWKPNKEIPYLQTKNLLDLATMVANAKAVYCNQNVGLVLAQGLGRPYFLEKKPFRNNTVMGTKNETIL